MNSRQLKFKVKKNIITWQGVDGGFSKIEETKNAFLLHDWILKKNSKILAWSHENGEQILWFRMNTVIFIFFCLLCIISFFAFYTCKRTFQEIFL